MPSTSTPKWGRHAIASAGNGQPLSDYDVVTTGGVSWNVPKLSATEREQQRVAYIAAVDAMATTLRDLLVQRQAEGVELERRNKALWTSLTQVERNLHAACCRIDALERAEAVRRSRSFMARLRWLVLGR